MKTRRMTLDTLLDTVRPTDMLPGDIDLSLPNRALWDAVFESIERNHVAGAPIYWARFAASVVKRQNQAISLAASSEGVIYCLNGHHRVWALVRANRPSVRITPIHAIAA